MKKQLTKLALAAWLTALAAGPASAGLVAGWDFSDLSGDAATVPTNLAANYVGTATASALNTSGDVVASAMRPGAAEADQSGLQGGIDGYLSKQDPTFPAGTTSFDRRGELLGLTARSTGATAEFDVTLPAPTNDFWVLTFGASAIAQNDSVATPVAVSFGGTCGATAPITTVNVSPEDTEISLFLGQLGSAGGCVVIEMQGGVFAPQPLIDNVAISTVPEPGVGAMLLAGVASLFGLARRRARA